MPAVGIASRIEWTAEPLMKKPPPALKLLPWKLETISTTIVMHGMTTFHHVSALLTRASQRMPIMLMIVKTAISASVTTEPDAVDDAPWNQLCSPL